MCIHTHLVQKSFPCNSQTFYHIDGKSSCDMVRVLVRSQNLYHIMMEKVLEPPVVHSDN